MLLGQVWRAVVRWKSTPGDGGVGARSCSRLASYPEGGCVTSATGLSLEYWQSMTILAVAVEAGRPLSVDEFTNHLKKTGYARVRIDIDVGKPFK